MESIDRYKIIGSLGSGAMGEVHLAEDRRLGRRVALKLLQAHLSGDPSAESRFENEAKVIASVNHPNIVKIFDIGQYNGRLFLSLELVDGPGLDKVLQSYGKLPNIVTLSLFRQIFSGLTVAHAQGILHRDIKPSNILIKNDGTVLLGDFGLAHAVFSPEQTQQHQLLGTPRYASPEAVNTSTISDRSDVFSTGSVLFECLYGRPAFPAETPHQTLMQITRAEPKFPEQTESKILPFWKPFLQKLLSRSTSERPSAEEAVLELDSMFKDLDIYPNPQYLADFLNDNHRQIEWEHQHLGGVFRRRSEIQRDKGLHSAAHKSAYMASLFTGKPVDQSTVSGAQTFHLIRNKRLFSIFFLILLSMATALVLLPLPRITGAEDREDIMAIPKIYTRLEDSAKKLYQPPVSKTVKAPPKAVKTAPKAVKGPPKVVKEPQPSSIGTEKKENLDSIRKISPAPVNMPPGDTIKEVIEKTTPADISFYWPKTSPPFTRVILDGKMIGETPFSQPLKIKPGKHRVRFIRGGFEEKIKEFEIFPGDTAKDAIILKRLPE